MPESIKAGNSFRDLNDGPEMVVVPTGRFLMGTDQVKIDELTKMYGDYFKCEAPRHEVIVFKAFAVGKYPITFREWDSFLFDRHRSFSWLWKNRKHHEPEDAGWGRDRRPVIHVSWDDAQDYINWLNGKVEVGRYRLLSESEWEYACRAGSGTAYCCGESEKGISNYAWLEHNSNGKTHPVGGKEPNAFGLFDLHGNVWEWCEDVWHDNYANKPESIKITGGAWTTGDSGRRVLRGGCWAHPPPLLRAGARLRLRPSAHGPTVGFRVAKTL